mgnify:CR=1 FL=1
MNLTANELIKILLAKEQITQKELSEMLSDKTDKNYTQPSLSRKLTKGTISYNEIIKIAEILGYELEFKKIEN